jgi:hypothetical protein
VPSNGYVAIRIVAFTTKDHKMGINPNALLFWAILAGGAWLIWGDAWHTVAAVTIGFLVSFIIGML